MSQNTAGMQFNMIHTQKAQAPEMSRQMKQLEDSCKDFEAVFTNKLLEVMRKTVPEESLIDGGRAEEIFTGLMNEEIAKNIADTGQLGLSEMMFTQLKQQLFGNDEIVDPSLFNLDKDLMRIDVENSDVSTADGISELLETGKGDEGIDLVEVLAQEGAGAEKVLEATDALLAEGLLTNKEGAASIIPGDAVKDSALAATVTTDLSGVSTAVEDVHAAPQNIQNIEIAQTHEGMTQTTEAEVKAVPVAETSIVESTDTPVLDTVRKDAMDRYRRADGKNDQRSFAAHVSESIRTATPVEAQDMAQAKSVEETVGVSQEISEETDISLLKDDIAGKVASHKRAEGFVVPQEQVEAPKGEEVKVKESVKITSDDSSIAFQRMQLLGTTTETEQADILRTTIDEPAKAMNQIIRSAEVMVKEGRSEMTIELQPRHLGEVRINIVMDNDVLTAKIQAKNEMVVDMIKLNLGQLADSLKDMGFDVSNFDVSGGADYGYNHEQTGEREGESLAGSTQEFIDTVEPEAPEQYRSESTASGQYVFNAVA